MAKSNNVPKPANQGSAGKAPVAQPRKDGTPKRGSAMGGSTFFGKQPSGTSGSKNK